MIQFFQDDKLLSIRAIRRKNAHHNLAFIRLSFLQEFEKLMSEVDLILKNCEDCSKKTIGDHKRKLKLRMDFIQEALSDLDSQSSVLTKANELASQIIVSG